MDLRSKVGEEVMSDGGASESAQSQKETSEGETEADDGHNPGTRVKRGKRSRKPKKTYP